MLPVNSAGQFALAQQAMPWPPRAACPEVVDHYHDDAPQPAESDERWTSDGNSPLESSPQDVLDNVRLPVGNREGECSDFGPPPGCWDDDPSSLLVPPGPRLESQCEPRVPGDHAMMTAPSTTVSSTAMEWLNHAQLVLENEAQEDLAALQAAYTNEVGKYCNPKH